jgi:hypothetical protein
MDLLTNEKSVPTANVAPHAKSNCNRCWGKGPTSLTPTGQTKVVNFVCRCAVKRFLAANKGKVVMDKTGHLFYKEVPGLSDLNKVPLDEPPV